MSLLEHDTLGPAAAGLVEGAQSYLNEQFRQHQQPVLDVINYFNPGSGVATSFNAHHSTHDFINQQGVMAPRAGLLVEINRRRIYWQQTLGYEAVMLVDVHFVDDTHRPLHENVIAAIGAHTPFYGHQKESFATDYFIG